MAATAVQEGQSYSLAPLELLHSMAPSVEGLLVELLRKASSEGKGGAKGGGMDKLCGAGSPLADAKCVICTEHLAAEDRGHPCSPGCPHSHFHFDCLSRWAGVSSSCPLCKTPFSRILRLECLLFRPSLQRLGSSSSSGGGGSGGGSSNAPG